MLFKRRTPRDVLGDKTGISASIPEALAGTAIKAIILVVVGGVLATGFAFWAQATASADTSSGFQNANVAFEKAVQEADVVIGTGTNRVGLLRDLPDDKCEVQTWQNRTRDGKTALQVDITSVNGVCTPTTPLPAAASTKDSKELVFDIATPVFTYANLGGRTITYASTAAPTLAAGAKPEGVKQADWVDARPYKVMMTLQSLSQDISVSAKKSVSTGFTNVVNVTEADDDLRYVPAPSSDPIPGPVRIASTVRSTVAGASFGGVKEGVAVSFTGGVCQGLPTKVTASFARNSPSSATPVSTVLKTPLDGSLLTLHLGQVPNGSTGEVELVTSCVEGGATSADASGYTQSLPGPQLTVSEGATANQHVLSWDAVSSLPTSFQVSKTAQFGAQNAKPAVTSALTMTLNYTAGTNYANKTDYVVVASVADEQGVSNSASVTGSWPTIPETVVTSNQSGASWTAIVCPAGSTPQYSTRYHQQVGTSTAVNWKPTTAWSTARTLSGVTTPGYGRTVTETQARCLSSVTGFTSPASSSPVDSFYAPEAVSLSASRSTTTGTAYMGEREGVQINHSGARCYNGTSARIVLGFTPTSPSAQGALSSTRTIVPTGTTQSVNIAGLGNGATGTVTASVTCTAGKSSAESASATFTQSVPTPDVTVAQGSAVNKHVVSWGKVSSLPTTFTVTKSAASGTEQSTPVVTTALTKTYTFVNGTTFGNKMTYTVQASVGAGGTPSANDNITTPWPATPKASGIAYARTGVGGLYQAGKITWALGSCPAGTTIYAQALENRTGQTNGTMTAGVRATQAWGANIKTYGWGPSYSYQGYRYGVGVNTKCHSNVTGLESAVVLTQGSDFLTPMAQPAAPKFNFHNYRTGANGSTTGYVGTCYRLGGVNCPGFPAGNLMDGKGGGYGASYSLHYNTYCSAGSSLNYSNVVRDEKQWNNVPDVNKPFDYLDGYQMSAGSKEWKPKYKTPVYDCKTPFGAVSPRSVVGAATTISVKRIWGS